jgi:uncharacterized membrane protein YbhN (UPF0104 family)
LKRWQFWVGVLISAVLLWWALRGLQLGEVWESLRGANYFWLVPGIAVYFMGVWARAWRWHYLLRPLKRIPTRTMFPIVAIGYMGNNIYPARAGEVLRALATLTVDSGFAGSIRSLALIGAGVFLGAVGVFLLMAIFPDPASRISAWLIERLVPERWRESMIGIAERFLEGLASLRSPTDVLMVLLTSVVIWLFETGKYWFVMQAFTFEVSFFTLMLMNGIVNLATTIPSAPGYVGTFDAPGIAVLEAYGVGRALAAGYTLILHVALWLPITALGAFYMLQESLSWSDVQEELAEGSG